MVNMVFTMIVVGERRRWLTWRCRAVNHSVTDSAITASGISSAKLVLHDKPVLLRQVSPDSPWLCMSTTLENPRRWKTDKDGSWVWIQKVLFSLKTSHDWITSNCSSSFCEMVIFWATKTASKFSVLTQFTSQCRCSSRILFFVKKCHIYLDQ